MAHDAMTYWIVLAACAIAVFTDVRAHRIPNWLTAGLAVLVLGVRLFQGQGALGQGLIALGSVLALGAVAFSLKMLGGGDVKLAAAVAAGLGFPDAASFVMYTLLAGGLVATVVALVHGSFRQTISATALLGGSLFSRGMAASPSSGTKVPYAIAIACGVLAIGASYTFAPMLRIVP